MESLIYYYQHIPYQINPVALAIGSFKVDWYSLMYILGFIVVYSLLKYRIKKGEAEKIFNFQFSIFNQFSIYKFQNNSLVDLLFYIFFGLIIGARLGYVFFYNFSYYLSNPLAIISPFDPITHSFIGIYGMSYHGGFLGAILAIWIFARKNKINFWRLADFIASSAAAGYFFGRIGNFLNGELWGRATEKWWGMYFPNDSFGLLRHPSQLYEAFLEGLVLFIILWKIRNNNKSSGMIAGLYISGYALFRILAEFFREPDFQIGYIFSFLTLGQLFSFIMLLFGIGIIFYSQRKEKML